MRPAWLLFLLLPFSCSRGGSVDADGDRADLAVGADMKRPTPDLAMLSCTSRQIVLDGTCASCDVVMPADTSDLAEAIRMAPAPGLVCVRPGSYAGNVLLRPHVSIVGSGRESILNGPLSLKQIADDDPTPTRIRNLTIVTAGAAAVIGPCPPENLACSQVITTSGKPVALRLEGLVMKTSDMSLPFCLDASALDGDNDITLRDSECQTYLGVFISTRFNSPRGRLRVVIERNRFGGAAASGSPGIYTAVTFTARKNMSGLGTFSAGSKIDVTIQNNEFIQTVQNGIRLGTDIALAPDDLAKSQILIRHNTFVSKDQQNAIWNSADPKHKVIVANNLYYACGTPILDGAPQVNVGNIEAAAAASPFVSVDTGDLSLRKDSAPLDRGDPGYMAPDDIAGVMRPVSASGRGPALPDPGAREYVPSPGPG